ncbi:MAG: leucine-rich repeat protein [Prevotella sp.]|nr:leucine-rich repeat protein [Prevotella sp.]
MKKYISIVMLAMMCLSPVLAQSSIYKSEGTCGEDVKWVFDGYTLTISNVNKKGKTVAIEDYDLKQMRAPWSKKLSVKKVLIERGITRIGSCAFANSSDLQEVVFVGSDMQEIGWGAFFNCPRLHNISLPHQLRSIETIAFARCAALTAVKIPDQCRVGDQAYVSCSKLQSLELSPTAVLGRQVFASEVRIGTQLKYVPYNGVINRVPSYVNANNCLEFGLSQEAVEKASAYRASEVDYDYVTSEVDSLIPYGSRLRPNTYALIIGNQNYRYASDVPYAIHDARVFSDYCKKTLGIPAVNVHIAEDATKQMILEEELNDWLLSIPDREDKRLIVYYAGHGVPDVKNKNKAYLLPTDVRGTSPQRGIALDELYKSLGDLAFERVSVFLDACFSGVNRNNEGVADGLRGVEIEAEEATFSGGNVVVFSAAQGNETAQGYPAQGHGLFTYFLLREIRYSLGDITYGLLSDALKANVSQQAQLLKMRKRQTPATNTSGDLHDSWRQLSF